MRHRFIPVLVALVLVLGSATSVEASHHPFVNKGLRVSTGGSFSVTQRFGGCVGSASTSYDLTVTVSYGAVNSVGVFVKSVKLAFKVVSFGPPSPNYRAIFVDMVSAEADGGDINGWSAQINHPIIEPTTSWSITKTVNRTGNWLGGDHLVRIISDSYPSLMADNNCLDELTVSMYFVRGTPL